MKKILIGALLTCVGLILLLIAFAAISERGGDTSSHSVGDYVAEEQSGLRGLTLDSVEFRAISPDSVYRLPANTFWVDAASGTSNLKPVKKIWFYGSKAVTPETTYSLSTLIGVTLDLQKASEEGLLGVMVPSDQFDWSDMDSTVQAATLVVVATEPKK